jgi:hypothetical protein
MKFRSVGDELLHADSRTDGQADLTKPGVDFRSFVKAPENGIGFLKPNGYVSLCIVLAPTQARNYLII